MWRHRFGGGFGPVVRQNTEWMNECFLKTAMTFNVTDKHQSKMCDRGKLEGQTPEIREFFAGRKVFITGGTGFLGAVLLEKLLRACPEIETVYLLVRPKRMFSVQERVSTLLDSPVSEVAYRLKHILSKTSFTLETASPATSLM